ncbi:MAG TPA: hypothetical protein VGE72_29965 [Azospirillum sp.]
MRPLSDPATLPRRPSTSRMGHPAAPLEGMAPDALPPDVADIGPVSADTRPEPVVERMRGPGLVLLWVALIAGSWAVVAALGYAVYGLITGAW